MYIFLFKCHTIKHQHSVTFQSADNIARQMNRLIIESVEIIPGQSHIYQKHYYCRKGILGYYHTLPQHHNHHA